MKNQIEIINSKLLENSQAEQLNFTTEDTLLKREMYLKQYPIMIPKKILKMHSEILNMKYFNCKQIYPTTNPTWMEQFCKCKIKPKTWL